MGIPDPDLPLEKPVWRSGSNSQNWTWNNRLAPNRKRSMSRLRNAGLEEAQAGIKIAGRNINNLIYADDTTLNGRKQRRTKEPLDESEKAE